MGFFFQNQKGIYISQETLFTRNWKLAQEKCGRYKCRCLRGLGSTLNRTFRMSLNPALCGLSSRIHVSCASFQKVKQGDQLPENRDFRRRTQNPVSGSPVFSVVSSCPGVVVAKTPENVFCYSTHRHHPLHRSPPPPPTSESGGFEFEGTLCPFSLQHDTTCCKLSELVLVFAVICILEVFGSVVHSSQTTEQHSTIASRFVPPETFQHPVRTASSGKYECLLP